MQIQTIIHEAEEGGYWAEVSALPGCVSQGETMEEVTSNIREAIEAYLSVPAEGVPADAGQMVEITV